jgi:hypothetical protein
MGKDTRNLLMDKSFPNSFLEPLEISSPETGDYNCLAWALNDNSKWYESEDDYCWFDKIDRDNKLSTIQKIFEQIGFNLTRNSEYQVDIERVALFSTDNIDCSHLARQIGKNVWTSKLGSSYDVNHTLRAIEDGIYGNPILFLERPHYKNL